MWPFCSNVSWVWSLLPLLLGLLTGWWAWARLRGAETTGTYDAPRPDPIAAPRVEPVAAPRIDPAPAAAPAATLLGDGATGTVGAGAAVAGVAAAGVAATAVTATTTAKAAPAATATTTAKAAPAAKAAAPAAASGGASGSGAGVAAAGAVALTAIGIPAAKGAADDLLRIKGIGPKLNGVLNGLGVKRFDQIASWTAGDVDKVDDHLASFKGRIGQEEWIPQAKLLAAGNDTEWTRIYGKATQASKSATGTKSGKATAGKAAAPKAAALTAIGIPAAVGAADNLLQIKGIGPKLNALLISLGVTRFDQIGAWGAAEVDKVDDHLGSFKNRIGRDNWIEQAGLLARGAIAEFEAKFGKLDSENK